MKTQPTSKRGTNRFDFNAAMRVVTLVAAIVLIAIPLFSTSSASFLRRTAKKNLVAPATATGTNLSRPDSMSKSAFAPKQLFGSSIERTTSFPLLVPQPLPPPSVDTFDSTCTTPTFEFNLGQTVCATVTSTGGSASRRRITWVGPGGFVRQATPVGSDPQSDTFTIPLTATTTLANGEIVNNIGKWRVTLVGRSLVTYGVFVVKDPANATADLSVTKIAPGDSQLVEAGSNGTFDIYVQNGGPDDAETVTVTDHVPDNSTFVTMFQTSGQATANFTCTTVPDGLGNVTCSIDTLAAGTAATFNFVYTVDAGTPPATVITNTVSVESATTNELNTSDNSSSAAASVSGGGGGSGTCTVACPDDITTQANTTQGSEDGAIVHFSPPSGNLACGSITTNHCNDCFFPVGTTVVSASSETGDGCSFTVTITPPNSGGTSISCPSDKQANADSDCAAVVNVGTATGTGSNVTVIGTRSDGSPMYDCDANGTNCTRRSSDSPFSAGVTTITWIAYSHDAPGPYASPDDEEAHRTGSASCVQSVTVVDVTPPTITAADQTASADANCMAAIPDFSTIATASDNCACASSDNSEACVGRQDISIAQSPAAGTVVGLGPHTITLTANDGSSNNGGAGNTATVQVTFTVKDTTPPTIHCPANITTNTDPGLCSANVNPGTATATDNCDNSPTIVGTRSDGQALNAPYPQGTTTITWTATDHASPGNQSSCVQTITVEDHEPPTINCQADLIADFNPAVNGAVVTYTAPVGTDNCASTTTQIAGLPSGSTFPIGTTVNTFKVTDGSGNSAQCSFKVTVALTSIIGVDSVSITGSGLVDSYDSTGGYPATKGNLANVFSNGTITIGGSGKVSGNVRSTRAGVAMSGQTVVTGNATAGTTVTKSGSAVVNGVTTNNALAPFMTLPSVPACSPFSSNSGISGTYTYSATTGDLTLSGINSATLANGNYCFHNVKLTNSGQLKVNGPVTIMITGVLSTSGATSLPNTTQIPSNLRILSSYSGSNGVTFGNSSGLQLVVYAPTTNVSITGSAPLFGTVVGKTITLSNSGMIHYDTKLKTIWPDIWPLIFGP